MTIQESLRRLDDDLDERIRDRLELEAESSDPATRCLHAQVAAALSDTRREIRQILLEPVVAAEVARARREWEARR